MMKPIPSRITANMTSVKVKPRRKRGLGVRGSGFRREFAARFEDVSFCISISFASNQRAVVAVDDQGDGIFVDPVFFGLLGPRISWQRRADCTGPVDKAAAGDLGIRIGEILAVEGFGVEQN